MDLKTSVLSTIVCAVATIGVAQSCFAETSNPIHENSDKQLSAIHSWSITRISPEHDDYAPQLRKKPPGEIVSHAGAPNFQTTLLTRVGETKCVAVLQWRPEGGPVRLNPEGFNYGPIPPINQLSLKEADSLWGTDFAQNSIQSERTYKLANDWYLDLVFSDDRISKYRLRSPMFETYDRLVRPDNAKLSDWQAVR